MRVALLSYNAQIHNAVGNHIAEKVRFFLERGAEVRVFVQVARRLHPELDACVERVDEVAASGPVWDYLRHADIVFAVYGQYHDLLQYLPLLAGTGPRLVFDYLGVTPPHLWHEPKREGLHLSVRRRGYAWCADHVLTISDANRRELLDAIDFPETHTTTLPLAVDTAHFQPGDARYLRDRLGICGPILLYVGRLAGNKRVSLLIEALTKLPGAHAVIVGDCGDVYAEEATRCQALAGQLGVAGRVHFIGQLDDAELAQAYRGADVLVSPSLHEGFCVPVIEAMASGAPVLASRSAALPETVGDAGLTFVPDDVADLAMQAERVLAQPVARQRTRRIAIVSFRFGPDIVGGAETSLRTMAKALPSAGYAVEVFTTCTTAEARRRNELPAGTTTLSGLPVHRFPIDAHDPVAHGETVRAILEAGGTVSEEDAQRYLQHSIHSTALLDALRQRRDEFDAIIVGPYLFGLTADVVREFTTKALLVPCFHDEPLARLAIWPRLYSNVGGILYHSTPEQQYAQARLGVNHPNARVLNTCIALDKAERELTSPRPYVVYCGRYSAQKNVPLLVEWMRRYQVQHPGRLDLVLIGKGDLTLPTEPWLRDLGQVDDTTKRAILAGAKALVQLSTQESLSLVVLEAWAQATPVIVHRDCAVLADQVARSGGGVAVGNDNEFAAQLDSLRNDDTTWGKRGGAGRTYVEHHYGSRQAYADTLVAAIDQMRQPIAQQMRERGLARAATFARPRWQQRFAEFVEKLLTQPARACRIDLRIEPMRPSCRAAAGAGTLLVPVRISNAGTHAVTPDGPGRCSLHGEVDGVCGFEIALTELLLPGAAQMIAVPVTIPESTGAYEIAMWMEGHGMKSSVTRLPLIVETTGTQADGAGAAVFLDAVQASLPTTQALAELPDDYVDVTEGQLAPVKRLIKRKLLNNFKHAYVDVLSRQQSQVNGQVVMMIHQLAECCALLDHAIAGLHRRIDGLEAKVEAISVPAPTSVDA